MADFLRRVSLVVLLVLVLADSNEARGQGSLTIVHTGGGTPIVSALMPLEIPPEGPGIIVSFRMGFATDEMMLPGTLLDAATASLSGNSSALFLPLVTIDASGAVWAPGGEGTVPLPVWAISREIILVPDGTPALAQKVAWEVSLAVPDVFLGSDLVFFLDLFDNANDVESAAWFSDLNIEPIPEPAHGGMIVAMLACFHWFCRRDR